MLSNFKKELEKKAHSEQGIKHSFQLVEKLAEIRFGSYEKAEIFMTDYANEHGSEMAIEELLKILYLDKILLFKPLLKSKSIYELLRNIIELKKVLKNHFEDLSTEEKEDTWKYFQNVSELDMFQELIIPVFGISKDDLETKLLPNFMQAKIKSKKELSDEFGVDKKTFALWLKYFYGDRFDKVKKFTLSEYARILEDLSLKEGENNKWIGENIEEYVARCEAGLSFNRKDMLKTDELKSSNYKELKAEIEEDDDLNFPFKKVPFSLKEKIIKLW